MAEQVRDDDRQADRRKQERDREGEGGAQVALVRQVEEAEDHHKIEDRMQEIDREIGQDAACAMVIGWKAMLGMASFMDAMTVPYKALPFYSHEPKLSLGASMYVHTQA